MREGAGTRCRHLLFCPSSRGRRYLAFAPARAGSTLCSRLSSLTVEGDGGVDQRQVREGLREVAELAAGGVDLLGEQPEVVAVGLHFLERQDGVVEPAGPREGVDVQERAERERALAAVQPVRRGGRVVPVDQAVRHQFAVHALERGQPHRVGRGDEALDRHEQEDGVEHLGVVVLGERLDLVVPPAVHDLVVDPVPLRRPLRGVGGPAVPVGQLDRAVQRDPALEPAVGEVLGAAASLPDTRVGLVPVAGDPVDDLGEGEPAGVRDGQAVVVGGQDRVHGLAVDVELQLTLGAVADAHRP